MKLILLILIFSGVCMAEGPLFRHQQTDTQQEFENVYQDLRLKNISTNATGYDCIDDPTFCVDSNTHKVLITTTNIFNAIVTSSGNIVGMNHRLGNFFGNGKKFYTDIGTDPFDDPHMFQTFENYGGNNSTRWVITNSSNGYAVIEAHGPSSSNPNFPGGSIDVVWAGDGPTSGWFPGYLGNFQGGVHVTGRGGFFQVQTSSLAIGTVEDCPIEFFSNNTKTVKITSQGITFPATFGIVGVTDASVSQDALVGRFVSSATAGNQNFPATTVWGDLAQVTLTAGNWILTANIIAIANGATVNTVNFGILDTSGDTGSNTTSSVNRMTILPPTATSNNGGALTSYEVNNAGSVTYYLKYYADYSVATPRANGRLMALRIR